MRRRVRRDAILVVEDHEETRAFLLRVLEGAGYPVVEAGDAIQAIEALEARRVILVIADLALPGLSGAVVAKTARRHNPGTKVLYISGYDRAAALAEGWLERDDPFLQKPFDAPRLLAEVHDLLGTGEATSPSRRRRRSPGP
ncbi:MAG: response regulator [Planctomycetes bacterium]|nr:response regulator [Planctomycetota bacterium]